MNSMIREDKHNVRISFDHGNPITLELKGCGNLYIHPNKDYFFYNAPIKFIDYIIQLRRLGVTYKLTTDKKGCYMAIDLTNYESADPRSLLGGIRDNIKVEKVATPKVVKEVKEPVIVKSDADEADALTITPEDIIDARERAEEVSPEVVEDTIVDTKPEEVEEKTIDITKKYSDSQLEKMSKPDLIAIAHALGQEEVSDLMKKREIKDAILKAQA